MGWKGDLSSLYEHVPGSELPLLGDRAPGDVERP
jgi:hypothetical protein